MPFRTRVSKQSVPLLVAVLASMAWLGSCPASAQEVRKGTYVVPDRLSGEQNQDSDDTRRDRDLGLRGRDNSRVDDFRNDRTPYATSPRLSNEPAQTLSDRPAPFGIQGQGQPANSWAR